MHKPTSPAHARYPRTRVKTLSTSLLVFLLLLPIAPVSTQPPPPADSCQSNVEGGNRYPHQCVCDQTYALCIAASCNPATGECGVMAPPAGSSVDAETWPACDQAGLEAGTCGPCYVFEGDSFSDPSPANDGLPLTCPQAADGLHSTFSHQLTNLFDFQPVSCGTVQAANCMGGACTPTDITVTLTDNAGKTHQVSTATCTCVMGEGNGFQALPSLDKADCSVVWSAFPVG